MNGRCQKSECEHVIVIDPTFYLEVIKMSCPFYVWRSDYYCIKTESSKPADIYSRYCRGYDYGDCPIYKSAMRQRNM